MPKTDILKSHIYSNKREIISSKPLDVQDWNLFRCGDFLSNYKNLLMKRKN